MNARTALHTSASARVETNEPRRIGFIIPSSNRRFEPEAAAFLPACITPHIARARITVDPHAAAGSLMPQILDAARCLADARCELIFLHCTAFSMELGPEGERDMLMALRNETAMATGATGHAVRSALRALEAKRLSIVTPYDMAMTDDEQRYLQACGFAVANTHAFELGGSDAYCNTLPEFWRSTLEMHRPRFADADAVLLSCANIRCLESIDAMEAAAARPVVTSNQAALWYAARAIGYRAALPGLGCLASLNFDDSPDAEAALLETS